MKREKIKVLEPTQESIENRSRALVGPKGGKKIDTQVSVCEEQCKPEDGGGVTPP